MKLIYVAGPFRGKSTWEIENNIRRAEEVGAELAKQGFFPVIPHTMLRFFQGLAEDSFWLEGDLELLRRCDAVVMVPGWERSVGASKERQEALRLGIPVAFFPELPPR